MLLRFVAGRPVGGITCAFLAWVAGQLAAEGVRVPALIWDNAPWHVSRAVRAWIRDHNRRAKRDGGCRLPVCRLPVCRLLVCRLLVCRLLEWISGPLGAG